jgi:hypothetical protein
MSSFHRGQNPGAETPGYHPQLAEVTARVLPETVEVSVIYPTLDIIERVRQIKRNPLQISVDAHASPF